MNELMTRRQAREAAPRKRWSRKRKAIVAAVLTVGLAGAGVGAYAAFQALAGVSGSGTNAAFTVGWESTAPTMDTANMTIKPASAPTISGGKLALPAVQMFPSESFTVTATLKAGDNMFGYVSGLTMPGLPSGYTAELTSGCGQTINYAKSVTIKVTAPATQTAGATWSLGAGAGVLATPLASSGDTAPAGTTCAKYTAP